MSETIFEKILDGRIPADVVYQDEHVFAFRDINPVAPIHVLVIPRRKFLNLIDAPNLSPSELGLFIQGIATVAKHVGLELSGYRVVFNNGADAQQSVPYVHAHILGGRSLSWPPG